jgi:DNA-binding CsgD family transcriptional regulator
MRMPRSLKGAVMLAWALAGEHEETALVAAEQILEGCRLDDPMLPPITAALTALICADQLDRAAFWCHLLLDEATDRGVPTWQAVLRATGAMIEVRRGNMPAAQTHAQAALSLLSPRAWGVPIGAPLAAMVLATTAMGKDDEAAEYLRMPVPDAMFETPFGLMYLRARGRHYLSTNRLHAALADFQSCGERMIAWGLDLPAILPWRTEAAQAYLKMGKSAEARELVDEQLARLGRGHYRTRGISLRVLAMTTQPKQKPALLREAVDLLRESGDRLELAHAFADLSLAHRSLGEGNRADMSAWRAYHLAEQCSAEPLKRTLQSRTSTTPEHSGDANRIVQLSAAERQVAALAAHGYTNRQVASKLHVTVSTVEQHLTRVYRKLRVSCRADLPTELQFRMPSARNGHRDGREVTATGGDR